VQGFELVKQLLGQAQPYRIVLGCRDTVSTKNALAALKYDACKHEVSVLPLELSDLKTVRSLASHALNHIGTARLDYLSMLPSSKEQTAQALMDQSGRSNIL
jgi:hypothetical protein